MRVLRIALVYIPSWLLFGWTIGVIAIRNAILRRGSRPWTITAVLVCLRLQVSRETLQAMQTWALR